MIKIKGQDELLKIIETLVDLDPVDRERVMMAVCIFYGLKVRSEEDRKDG